MKHDKSNPQDLERNLPSSHNPSSGRSDKQSYESDRIKKDRGSEGVSGPSDKDKLGDRGSSSISGSERT